LDRRARGARRFERAPREVIEETLGKARALLES
jgi:hypothetical protein